MSAQSNQVREDDRPSHPQVDASRLWSGGIATAVVAGLIALVGVLACRWLFGIAILAPRRAGAYGDIHTTDVVLTASGAALVATALLHLLLLTTPRPLTFFRWIIGLMTVAAMLLPFSTTAPLSQKLATAAVVLVIGIAIGSLLTAVARRSAGWSRPPRDDPPNRRARMGAP
jgi:Family of unknown function (DUF6069)